MVWGANCWLKFDILRSFCWQITTALRHEGIREGCHSILELMHGLAHISGQIFWLHLNHTWTFLGVKIYIRLDCKRWNIWNSCVCWRVLCRVWIILTVTLFGRLLSKRYLIGTKDQSFLAGGCLWRIAESSLSQIVFKLNNFLRTSMQLLFLFVLPEQVSDRQLLLGLN